MQPRKGLGDRRDWRDLRSTRRNQIRERLKGKMKKTKKKPYDSSAETNSKPLLSKWH